MKEIFYGIFFFALFSFTTEIDAQVQLGVKAGVNLSTITNANSSDILLLGESLLFDFNGGFHFGITGEIPISQKISFESGVTFIRKGYPYGIVDVNTIGQSTFIVYDNFNALEIPLLVKAFVDIAEIKLDIFVGPTVSYAFIETGISSGLTNENGFISNIGNGRNFDYGMQFGAGVTVNDFNFSMFYNLGLANYKALASFENSINNTVSGMSFKYTFKRKKKD